MAALSIFMCDDSAAFRRLLALQLEAHGGAQMVGDSGSPAEALEQVGAVHPDAVLIDSSLIAHTDAPAFIRGIRERAPGAVVVLFSGLEVPVLERQREAWGADVSVHKDTRVEGLMEAIEGASPPSAGAPALG